jgi:hypothetical protein
MSEETEQAEKEVWKRNPEYDKATHAIWWCGLESFETFWAREFPGQPLPKWHFL